MAGPIRVSTTLNAAAAVSPIMEMPMVEIERLGVLENRIVA